MKKQPLSVKVKVTIGTNKKLFGPGAESILELVDELGSLSAACRQLHMSYSKAWCMLRSIEQNTGYHLVDKYPGGAEGGNSVLTADGRKFLTAYRKLREDLEALAAEKFPLYFWSEQEANTGE